ncbi:uncharacterized protein LOC144881183 [Branchiostoma floridae x Branchiostoma japonicum]
MDVRQLLTHGGDATSLSEAELGRLQKQYEKLRREWARKRRKLEKLDRAAKAKQHVRQRLQDQSSETGGAVDTASPLQQTYSSRDGDQEKVSVCEGKSDHPCREGLTGAEVQSRKSVSFSLDVLSTSKNIQRESLSTVLRTEDSTMESTPAVPSKTDSPRVCSHLKGEDMSTNVLQQSSRTSYKLDGLLGSENNNILSSDDTVNEVDGNDSSTHHQDISAPQESFEAPSMEKTSCSKEDSSENKLVENLTEQGELNCVPHCENVKQKISPNNRHRKPLFKGLSKQAVLEEKLEQVSEIGVSRREDSGQIPESYPGTTDNTSPRNISASTCVPNSSLELVEEVSPHEVKENRICEKKIPDQEIHGALGDSIIVLDSQESQTECSDNSHLSSNVLSRNKAKEEKSTCVNGIEDNRGLQTSESMFSGSQNMPTLTSASVPSHKSQAQKNRCSDSSVIVLNSQEIETERSAISNLPSNFLSESERNAIEEKDICVDMGTPHTSEAMLAGSPSVHVPASITGPVPVSSNKSLAQENKCDNDVSQTTAQLYMSQEKLHTEEEDSQVVAPSQKGFHENTWVDGLMFPAEYYIRTTRGMQRQGRTPEGVARQVRARKPRRQKRKLGADSQDASEGACGSKQARLNYVRSGGTTSSGEGKLSSGQGDLEVAKDSSLKVLESLTKEGEDLHRLSPGMLTASLSEDDLRSDKFQFSTEVAKDIGGREGVSLPAGQGSGATGVHGSTSTGGQVCSTPGEGHLSTGGQVCSTGGQVCSTPASPGEGHLSADASSQDSVIPDTQYSPAKSAFLLKGPQKCLQVDLPKDLFSEDAVHDNLQVLRKGRKALSSHNTPVQSSGSRRLVRGRKMTRSCQNSPAGFSSVPGGGNLSHQDQSQVVSSVQRGRKTTGSCQNSPVQTVRSSSVPGEENLTSQDQFQVVPSVERGRKMTRSCQNSPVPTAGLLTVPGEENLTPQDCTKAVSSVERKKKMTKSCQNSPVLTARFSSVPGEGNLSPKDWTQDSSQRSEEGKGSYRRSRRLAVRCSQESQSNGSQSTPKQNQKVLKEVQIGKVPGQSETIPRVVQDSQKDITKMRKIFPILSDRLKEKLENSEASEFHLPYSDYGTLKVAKAREAPPTDLGKNSRRRHSSATDPKDVPVPSEGSSINLKEEETLASIPRFTETSRKKQRLAPSPYIRNTSSPKDISKTELGQDKKQSVFPCLSPLLHKKCTEEVLDFSLVGQEFVKLKLNKVKSSPRPAAATSSSGHGKHRQQNCKAKENLPASGTRSGNSLNEKGHECTDVENDKQKMCKIAEGDSHANCMTKSFLHKNKNAVVDLPEHVDTHAQRLLAETNVRRSEKQTRSKQKERDKVAILGPDTESEDVTSSPDPGVGPEEVKVMCEVKTSSDIAHTSQVKSQTVDVLNSKSSSHKADVTAEEKSDVCNSKPQESQNPADDKGGEGGTEANVPFAHSKESVSSLRTQEIKGSGVEITCVGADSASLTPAQDSHEMTLQGAGVEETGEDVATSLPEFSACLQLRAEAVVALTMGEAIIQGETVSVLAVCQRTQLVVWVQRGQEWIHTAAWDIHKEEVVCDICLLPCEVRVQLVVGGNFPSGHLRLFYTDGVSSRLDHSWADAEDGDSFYGDGKTSYHAMTVLPGSVAIATGSYDRGSSVCKLAFSRDGHVRQHTRLAMSAVQRVGSLQPVRGCEGCLLGTSRNQILLWNHTTGVLLRCVDLPGVFPQLTCLYAAADQGLIFALVSNHGKEQQEAVCSLLSINPATGCSLTLHKYRLGSTSGRCIQGYLCGSRLFAALDSGEVCMWGVFTAQMGAVLQGDTRGRTCLTVDRNLLCLGTSQGCVHLYSL